MRIHAMAAERKGSSLKPWEYDCPSLKPHECLIRVTACGICHSDIHMIDNDWNLSKYPLVPGHEVVGEMVECGAAATGLRPGQRVGAGWQRSACLACRDCLRGSENLCNESQGVITHGRGGFADYLLMDSRFCFPIPAGLPSESAGPLLCGGITVYSALRHAGMTSGQEIGVIGMGGLGHLAVQFAAHLGNRVTVFTTSPDKAEASKALGAHTAFVCEGGVVPDEILRPLNILINTVPMPLDWNAYLNLLGSDGVLTFVGVPGQAAEIALSMLLFKRRRITASPIGGRAEILEMLDVAERFGVAPKVEVFHLSECNQAIQRVRENKIRYRAVLRA